MIVTDISSINKKRYKIIVDEEIIFPLYYSEMKRLQIKVGSEISIDDLAVIYKDILLPRAKKRALNLLGSRDYTEKGMVTKLSEGLYPEDITSQVIDYLKGYGYIDDLRYARLYTESKIKDYSMKIISNKLYAKGISKDIIDQISEEFDDEDSESQYLSAKKQFMSKLKRLKVEDYSNVDRSVWNKVYTFMMSKGYSYDLISKLKDEVENGL